MEEDIGRMLRADLEHHLLRLGGGTWLWSFDVPRKQQSLEWIIYPCDPDKRRFGVVECDTRDEVPFFAHAIIQVQEL